MATQVWRAEDIKRHLQAVHTGVEASVPTALVTDNDGTLAAYRQGCQAALNYLVELFGLKNPAGLSPTNELRLKTWSRDDLKRNLEVAQRVMRGTFLTGRKPDTQLAAYYQGIDDVLHFMAISFNIETLVLLRGVSDPAARAETL